MWDLAAAQPVVRFFGEAARRAWENGGTRRREEHEGVDLELPGA